MSVADESLRLSGLFEAELLVELMLRYWEHPFAADEEFRRNILEQAVECLKAAVSGEKLFDELPSHDVNLVAAVWYAEWNSLTSDPSGGTEQKQARQDWADNVRSALPSCFCNPDLLE